ncbi:hypothetical protein [Comamonas sp. GB3 AK4-5]|uniref:hypothetical protein n=1 Tax=Comamonas sp. GB3 AK4-5 TaxID=3231487 RepID=UPI00351DC89F
MSKSPTSQIDGADLIYVSTLVKVCEQAANYVEAVKKAKSAKLRLQEAYIQWRSQTGNQHTDIDRNSREWIAMMGATKPEYRALLSAKARERRAQAKLLRAVGGN